MPTPTRLLILDAPAGAADALRRLLAVAGHETVLVTTMAQALEQLAAGGVDVVLAALEVVGVPGLAQLSGALAGAQLMVLAADVEGPEARDALRLGAFDLHRRSAPVDALLHGVERAARVGTLWREVAALRARVGERVATALVGRSSAMELVRELIGRAAATRQIVLISGEAGTGKDLVARLVHDLSERAARPFMTICCDAADARTLEAELFGEPQVRGGLFEMARGGTLVLDGVGHLPKALRIRIADVLARSAVERVTIAGTEVVPVDVRVILTTRDEEGADAGELLRDEVFGRSNVLPIAIPPLRERRRDIPLLVAHFTRRAAHAAGDSSEPAIPDLLSLISREWPGNVRELEHFVARGAHLPASVSAPAASTAGAREMLAEGLTLEEVERRHILAVLNDVAGNQSRAAERLGIDRRTLYRKLKQYRDEGRTLRIAI